MTLAAGDQDPVGAAAASRASCTFLIILESLADGPS